MTNRDPNTGDFTRKFNELYQCVHNYLSLKRTEEELLNDLEKPDINLVCNYEIHELKMHVRSHPWALSKFDFDFIDPRAEMELRNKLDQAHKV